MNFRIPEAKKHFGLFFCCQWDVTILKIENQNLQIIWSAHNCQDFKGEEPTCLQMIKDEKVSLIWFLSFVDKK